MRVARENEQAARNEEGREEAERLETLRYNTQTQRELELLKRENMLMQRELLRREQMQPREPSASPASAGNTDSSDGQTTASATLSIRAIGDLLSDFDGRDNTFWKWEQQINLLRATYHLDNNATRVLISSRLRGRAVNWFHSKSEHITLPIDDLLTEMRRMFDRS